MNSTRFVNYVSYLYARCIGRLNVRTEKETSMRLFYINKTFIILACGHADAIIRVHALLGRKGIIKSIELYK